MNTQLISRVWDHEYQHGKYHDEGPVPFVREIINFLQREHNDQNKRGLYIGCGNGRNYMPLVDTGLNLAGIDVSAEGLSQIREQRPRCADKFLCIDFLDIPKDQTFDYLISLQIFQHGAEAAIKKYFNKASDILSSGGFLFLRVNSVNTQIGHAHTVLERSSRGGMTILYNDGPKRGLKIHFYSKDELHGLLDDQFTIVMQPREDIIQRKPPRRGFWAQWEMIAKKQ